MANDYKPVNDKSIADVNKANRDAWDSGEFRHTSDGYHNREEENEFDREDDLRLEKRQKIANKVMAKPKSERKATLEKIKKKEGKRFPPNAYKANSSGSGVDSVDVRHTPEGKQQVAHGEQVVAQHDRANHLPRTRKRTWKNGTWS